MNPDELDAPDGLLDEAFDMAMTVEGLAQEHGTTWQDARELV